MRRKRIVCTVTNDLNYDQRMIRICTSLVEAGYDVCLVGRKKKNSIPLKKRKFQQKRIPCFFEKGKFFYLEYNFRLFFYLLFLSFDILNSIDLDTILPGYLISKSKRKKWVYDAHEYFTEVPEVVGRPTVQKIWKVIEGIAVPKVDAAYTVCSSLAELFEKEYKIKFEVIRNVPFRKKDKKIKTGEKIKTILYQGALNEGRGLEEMIEAMQEIEGAELQIAGEGDLSEKLRQKVKADKLENKIKFLGYVQPEELSRLTLKADIGLNLLENKGLSYYYSLANKCFDYIQAGVPGIHMDFPEYRKIMETHEIGMLIPDLQKEHLVRAIHKLLRDESYYLELQNNCKAAAEFYIWEKEVEKLISVYRNLETT